MPKFSHFFLSSLIAVTFASPVFAADIVVDIHQLRDVTVYNDRADLTEVMSVDLPKGAHNIIIPNLPLRLRADSVRASGIAQADVVLGALSAKRETSLDLINAREKEITDKIKEQELAKSLIAAEVSGLHAEKKLLSNIGDHVVKRENEQLAKMTFQPEEWSNSAAHIGAKIAQNLKETIALEQKIVQIDEILQKLNAELRQVRSGVRTSYSVTLPVDVSADTTLTLNLEYQINNARWRPIYDARLDTQKGSLEIIQYAQVSQNTGYDWEDVNLTLSTAQPSRGAQAPDVSSRWVSLFAPDQIRALSAAPKAAMLKSRSVSTSMEEADFAAAPALQAEMQSAVIDNSGFVSEYQIAGLSNVKSDGSWSKHLIGSFDTKSALEVQIAPQYSQSAYLVAKTTLEGDAPILAGAVNLFRDGAFIGTSYLPLLRAGDAQDLSFGIDDQVTVERLTLKDERSEAGMITKETSVEKHFTTKIKNTHKMPISISVIDAVPVSKDERIRVDVLAAKTTAGYSADYNDQVGVYRWAFDAKAGEEEQINLGWKVSWPKGQNISGL